MRLLITRPEPDAQRTAAALRARCHDVTIASLLRIEPVADADLTTGPYSAVLVTSANAAIGIAGHPRLAELRGLAVLAVGDRSAQAMRDLGFAAVMSAGGDVGDLARLAAQQLGPVAQHKPPDTPLLYLAGTERSGDLAGLLVACGFPVRTVEVYRAVAATALPGAALDVSVRIDGVLHFSQRSAQAYVAAAQNAGLTEHALARPIHFCLSAQIAEPLAAAGATDIRVAPRPTEADLIELIAAA